MVTALASRLATIDILAAADADTLAELAARSRSVAVDAGATIIDQDDEGHEIYGILDGVVRVTLLSPRGQEVSFRDQPAGTAVGLLAAIDGRPRSASIVAMQPTRIAVFTADALKAAMARSPGVMDAVLQHLAFLVRELSERVFEFSTLVARQRVHAELLRLAEHAERDVEGSLLIRPAPTHASIAARISTQRETVSREISTLTRMGVIKRRSGALAVCDLEALKTLVASARESED